MKFARFEKDGKPLFGVVEGENIRVATGSILSDYELTDLVFRIAEVKLLPPATPSKIVCVAHNYRGLIEQIGEPFPAEPILFLKPPSCLIGQGDAICIPSNAQRVIFEGELAVIVKYKMKRVPPEKTLACVAGYACFNDVTERAMIEKNHFMLSLGKGMDTFGPCGPYLVNDIDPANLEIATYLNGRKMQSDNTANCIFPLEFLLHFISERMTLYPGDIVTTGTPQGVDTLSPQDVVEVEIERIGRLKSAVVAEAGFRQKTIIR
jgi:2-keto-4-pentenoate hydratase/2-oxohepta-3-ene-1,7-dioic acid hydratase in catechol pathway